MRELLKTLKSSSRSALTVFSAMMFVLTLGLASSAASGQTVPPAVWSQVKFLTNYPDGSIAGGDPSGTTMGVNQQGLVFFGNTYGNNLYELNPATGVLTTLGSPGNIAGVAVDSNNSVYFTNEYGTQITKLPYVNGGYTYPASLSGLPTCTGTDTTACVLAGTTFSADGYYFGVSSLTFDASGDVFVALTNGNTAPNAIIYCSAACSTGAAGNGSLIFQEPTATPQLTLGSMATDAKGNLYFTDSAQDSSGNITVSHVYELPLTAPGTFAATPTLLYTITPSSATTDQIDAVAVAGSTLYFATTNDGIFAMPIVAGVANPSAMYAVAAQGAKVMGTDGKGTFFVDTYANGSDNITEVSVGTITGPPTAVGQSATLSGVTTVLNDGDCTSTAITFTPTPGEFTADTTGSTCVGFLGKYGSFATNVTFAPTAAGVQTETLTATDTAGGIGTVTGTGTGVGSTQTITFTAPVSPVVFGVAPITLAATASSGLAVTFSVTSGPGTISGDTLTVTGVGTIVVAANQAGNAGYSAAPTVSQSIVVNKAAQTIAFTVTSPVTYGVAPITLSATASSGLAVTLSVTSGPATIKGNTLTVTNDGTIVLAANQSGNANYLAAPAVSQTIVVNALGTVATPVFSPAAGTFLTPPSVTLTDATAGASIYYTTDGTTPTASSTLYTGAITPTQTTTINAIAVETGYLDSAGATATYTIPPTITLAVNPNVLSVGYGASTAVSVTATSQYNFTGAVSFACSGLPTGATCTFVPPTAPATTTVIPGSPVVEQLTITAGHASAKLEQRGINPFIPGGATLAAAMFMIGLRKRRRLQVGLLTMLCMGALATLNGCSSGTLPLPPGPTTTAVTITATAGSVTTSQTLSLTER